MPASDSYGNEALPDWHPYIPSGDIPLPQSFERRDRAYPLKSHA